MPTHPLDVKPLGNALLFSEEQKSQGLQRWNQDLGRLAILPDEVIFQIIERVSEPLDLMHLGQASRTLYAFTFSEELWKTLYLKKSARTDSIDWKGSWRRTVLKLEKNQEAMIQCPELCCDLLFRPYQCSQIDYKAILHKIITQEKIYEAKGHGNILLHTTIPRISEDQLTPEYVEQNLFNSPFIITNKDSKRWPRWTVDSLLQRFPKVHFQQESVCWTLEAYLRYLAENNDESPLYLFDCDSPAMTELSKEYKAPDCFERDLFTVFDQNEIQCRPNFRWLILGLARTGLTFHKDPNSTCAWNAVLSGAKLWVMVPPNMTPPGVETTPDESQVTSPVSLAEFVLSGFFNDIVTLSKIPENRVYISVTFPGEVNYVPKGWWHLVINIEDTVALTQNFVPPSTLRNTLDFFEKKSHQISGFRSERVRAAMKALVARGCSSEKRKKKIEDYLLKGELQRKNEPKSLVYDAVDDDEEISRMPLKEFFEELLVEGGFGSVLEKVEKRGVKRGWTDVIGNGGKGFTFNFEED